MTALFTLLPEAVGTIRAESKSAILSQLAERFGSVYGLDTALVLERIEERERLGSTGFGRGVAIPHARIVGVHRPVAAFLRLEAPVSFDAADGSERLVEVKTTGAGKHFPFSVTATEVRCSADVPDRYQLFRVFDFARSPRLYVLQGSLAEVLRLDPTVYRAALPARPKTA